MTALASAQHISNQNDWDRRYERKGSMMHLRICARHMPTASTVQRCCSAHRLCDRKSCGTLSAQMEGSGDAEGTHRHGVADDHRLEVEVGRAGRATALCAQQVLLVDDGGDVRDVDLCIRVSIMHSMSMRDVLHRRTRRRGRAGSYASVSDAGTRCSRERTLRGVGTAP